MLESGNMVEFSEMIIGGIIGVIIITVTPDDSHHFKINMSMIKKRKFIGQNLFNDETLYLHSIIGNSCFVTMRMFL